MTATDALTPWLSGGESRIASHELPRIAVAGGTGRLGSAVVRLAERQGFPHVGVISRNPPPHLRSSGPSTWVSSQALDAELAACDVLLSATTPQAEENNLPHVISAGIPLVLATTGLSATARTMVDRAAQGAPVVEEANFSPGVLLIERALEQLAHTPPRYEVGILEVHRRNKVDSPSATALRLAETSTPSVAGPVQITSLRLGEVPGFHQIFLAGSQEWIRIEHQAFDREVFAQGMLEVARALHRHRAALPPRRYRAAELLASLPRDL